MKKHHTVVIYTSGSQFCNLAKEYFHSEGIEYDEVKVGNDSKILDYIRSKTTTTNTPMVEIDGRAVSGYRPDLYAIILRKDDEQKSKN